MEEKCDISNTPNWSKLEFELCCPRCGYNLRLLTLPRCPECGLHFRWDELIRAKEDFSTRPPLFEYHWREHPIRSFSLTVSLCLQPWRLWRWLPLTAVPSIRPIPFLIVLVLALLALLSLTARYVWLTRSRLMSTVPEYFNNFPWHNWFYGLYHEIVPPSLLVLIIWISIQVFRQTILRYRVQQRHLLRVVVFCWIGVVGSQFVCEFVLSLMAASCFLIYQSRRLPNYYFQLEWVVDFLPLIILLLSLGFGFHSYLRVRGGWLWALLLLVFTSSLVVVVGLIVSVVVLDTFDNRYWRWLAEWSQFFSDLRDLAKEWAGRS